MYYYKFEYDIRNAMASFLVWLGTSKIFKKATDKSTKDIADAPIDIFDRMVIRSIRPFYIPTLNVSGYYNSTWSADIVTYYYETKHVPYTATEYSNGKSYSVTKYKEVQERKEQVTYASGPLNKEFHVSVVYCSGSTATADRVVLNSSSIGVINDIRQGFAAAYALQPYDDMSRCTIGLNGAIKERAETDVYYHLLGKGDKRENVRVSIDDTRIDNTSVTFHPVYQVLYEYNGVVYECCLDGMNIKHVEGDYPKGDNESESIEKKQIKVGKKRTVRKVLFWIAIILVAYLTIRSGSFGTVKFLGCIVLSLFWFWGGFINLSERKVMKRKQKHGLNLKEKMTKALVNNGFEPAALANILPDEAQVNNNDVTESQSLAGFCAALSFVASIFAAIGAFLFAG